MQAVSFLATAFTAIYVDLAVSFLAIVVKTADLGCLVI